MAMTRAEEIREFDALVPKEAAIHPATFCVKVKSMRLTVTLKGKECCNCPEFVLRGGACDPL